MATKDHYLALDMLRGIAAYVVFVQHFLAWVVGTPPERLHGYLAVDFFFLLSGFVIAYSYEAKVRSGMNVGRFMLIRLIRLYPMIFLALVFGVLHLFFSVSFGKSARTIPFEDIGLAIGAHLFVLPLIVPNAISPAIFPLNIPIWSLFFELVANFVHALILPRLGNRVLIGVVLASFAGWLAVGLQAGLYGFTVNYGGVVTGWPLGFVRVAFPYFLGVLMFRLKAADRLPGWSAHPLLLGALFLAAVVAPSFSSASLELPIIAVVFPTILLLGANSSLRGALARGAAFLGALSYPIYTVHVPLGLIVFSALSRLSGRVALQPSSYMTTALITLAVTAGAYLILKLFDEPLRTRLGAYLARTHRPGGGSALSIAGLGQEAKRQG